ncbi:hypothetical protein BJ138DRAFT_1018166 [Hygrophoropsis aurantiaca]|uniref:Uncharacterized protein n=1 Tax=Hygrophoropsis aurantiaca TaxID=72124 RepID=A0ACB7ZXP0_9AGAM|nr:hypothetical protein BJ138DRAFT_1018166 [Hygrophoropsis aurantiaca]
MTAFFHYCDFHSIETIALSCPGWLSPFPGQLEISAGVQEFFAALASSCSHNSIRDICIRWGEPDYDRLTHIVGFQPLGLDEFRPLLQLHKLQKLKLFIPRPMILEDATLLAMADAWPHISTLLLTESGWYNGPWHSSSYITPLTILSVLERCPKLERLTVRIDFSAIDYADFDPLSIDVLRIQDCKGALAKLTWLDLGPYIFAHPRAIARFLSAVLPDSARICMLFSAFGDEQAPHDASFRQTIKYMRQMQREKGE